MAQAQKTDHDPIIYVKKEGEFTEEELAQVVGGTVAKTRQAVSSTYDPERLEEGGNGGDKDYAMV